MASNFTCVAQTESASSIVPGDIVQIKNSLTQRALEMPNRSTRTLFRRNHPVGAGLKVRCVDRIVSSAWACDSLPFRRRRAQLIPVDILVSLIGDGRSV